MHLSPERATSVTLSALILHNYLLKSPSKSLYCTPGLIDQEDELYEQGDCDMGMG